GNGPRSLTNPQATFNIYPQHIGPNRGTQNAREGLVRAAAERDGQQVCVHIELVYQRSYRESPYPGRPLFIYYDVSVNGILNPPPFGGVGLYNRIWNHEFDTTP